MKKEKNIIKEGLLPYIENGNDFQLGSIVKLPKLSELPESYNCEPLMIKDQNADRNDDYCASYAATTDIEPKEGSILYSPYLFAAAKYLEGNIDGFGLRMKSVGDALRKFGCPEEKDVPKYIKNLDEKERRQFENYRELDEAAAKHKIQSYFFVSGPYDHFDNARAALWKFRNKKQNIEIGVKWGWPLEQVILSEPSDFGFGHALAVMGFTGNYIKVVNSCGKNAGDNGTHLITREVFNKFAKKYGMMMFVDIDPEKAKRCIDNKLRIDDNWLTELFKIFFRNPIVGACSIVNQSLLSAYKKIVAMQLSIIQDLRRQLANRKKTNSEKVYQMAVNYLGQDISPTQDEYGCVESVWTILYKCGIILGERLSTVRVDRELSNDPRFEQVLIPDKGDIIISITRGNNHGHIGIIGDNVIYSNQSLDSKWSDKYNLYTWLSKYRGLTTKYYRIK